MTPMQKDQLRQLMKNIETEHEGPHAFHHGCCLGADMEAHWEAHARGWIICLHPPIDRSRVMPQSYFRQADEIAEDKEFLKRNRDIVDRVEILIAAPEGPEVQRSGTWSTVRYARGKVIPIYLLRPQGER